jgi:nucleotide-binding universal stress UspA family protein
MGNRGPRRFTVYKNCPLPAPEDRLFFILVYLKTYTLQVVHGRLCGMVQGKANQWIHVLLPVLLAALRTLGDAPARSLTALAQRLGVSEAAAATVVTPLAEEPTPGGPIPAAVPAAPLLPMTGPNGASSAPKTLVNSKRVIAGRKKTTPSKMSCSSIEFIPIQPWPVSRLDSLSVCRHPRALDDDPCQHLRSCAVSHPCTGARSAIPSPEVLVRHGHRRPGAASPILAGTVRRRRSVMQASSEGSEVLDLVSMSARDRESDTSNRSYARRARRVTRARAIRRTHGSTRFASSSAKRYSVGYSSTPHGKAIPMEMHTILVPTDFSTHAEHALQEALVIARRDQAQVLLLHVLPVLTLTWPDAWPLALPQLEEQIQRDAEQQLQTIAGQHMESIEPRVLWGDPATVICEVAKTQPCELIVMSTHGRTGLAHVFIGSVAERVVRYAPCAVLIVRAFPTPPPSP